MFNYGGFRFQIATGDELIRQCQALRYQVYVQECGFERPEDHPQGLETDPFDDASIHAAATIDGNVVGTARLVLNSSRGLPIFHAAPDLDRAVNPRSTRLVECSRLAVHPGCRQFTGALPARGQDLNLRFPGGTSSPFASRETRNQSVVMTGLLFLLVQASLRLGLDHWIIIVEKKLWLHLKRKGIHFQQIGEPIKYHGLRIPYLGDCRELDRGLRQLHRLTESQFQETTLPADLIAAEKQ